MKHLLICSLLLLSSFAQATSKISTGFNYGAFWSVEANAKKKADFLDGFSLAKNLTTDIPFDSARLFTCKAAGTLNEPTEAFDAAVESRTNLLLGFWITPAEKGASSDENVKNEMTALEKGFRKHGHALSDLVIGLAVGSEDIYRAEEAGELGVTADVVAQIIDQVKKGIAESSFAQYMKDKPIGHVDTAKYAVVDNADFIGMTAYPYWHKDSIDTASTSFLGSLRDIENRAGNRPIWIAEMGWPSADTEQRGAAVAGIDELQRFWTEVGCAVFGKYTTFWYELLKDSTPDQKADWGLVDVTSRKPRISNLSCGTPNQLHPDAPPETSQLASQSTLSTSNRPTGFNRYYPSNVTTVPMFSKTQPDFKTTQTTSSTAASSTSYITVYETTTVTPPPISSPSSNASLVTVITTQTITTVITLSPSTTIATGDDELLPSPTSAISPCTSTSRVAFSTSPLTHVASIQVPNTPSYTTTSVTTTTTTIISPPLTTSPTPIPTNLPWCITVADMDRNGVPVTIAGAPAAANGECSSPPTFYGYPYIVTAGLAATPSEVPSDRAWCVTVADVDGLGQLVPVDAGPAGVDGECSRSGILTDGGISASATGGFTSSVSSVRVCKARVLPTPRGGRRVGGI